MTNIIRQIQTTQSKKEQENEDLQLFKNSVQNCIHSLPTFEGNTVGCTERRKSANEEASKTSENSKLTCELKQNDIITDRL